MSSVYTMRELLGRSFSRYITVKPCGLELQYGKIVQSISATILAFRPARTLYQNKKPKCRSLDGIQSFTEGRACASCLLRKACTPQICLEILHESIPFRLILSYTSARNFLTFISILRKKEQPVEGSGIIITVRDRGRWGELCFSSASTNESTKNPLPKHNVPINLPF